MFKAGDVVYLNGRVDPAFMYGLIIKESGKLYIRYYWADMIAVHHRKFSETSHYNWKLYSPALSLLDKELNNLDATFDNASDKRDSPNKL